ncbi:helix-turn-helix domain-containing protein [Saccharolobus islandicus]|jgi:predicted transcriptional regulator|uniref:Transcriptional regulator TrmB n=8 Tax=Saccharolobus islandicus TaxID=43080 RepID=C3MPB1_SACI2|nr:helix-turn-helix domain-containing protein [Sulfolobus islandicus]ACP35224.1 transcriptional regulator TrmB [Sulfolobus islandicus L.S.2.15]ACP37878.1 transcriptional regulator, TrmB [Sulfolobus islandicus M.14.25]ACP48821.1 transcriptional regulator, TrmB [Sulfolobus islandicus Y.N.15.51]ACP55068.1 transcriptional regulator, TrmB [Sulfolobus islandicus M.16.27]ACR41710.1 transcriptional regulator, TrmB [Sulfolobus islandicus M.16.4]
MSLKLSESKEAIRCCYKISDTDVECLFKLVELNRPISAEELASIMKLSKTTVENSLKKLIEIGLIVRNKDGEEGKRIGRPKYLYAVIHNAETKIKQDLTSCASKILSATSS